MNLLGLIVEYNPFHNGHLYHLNESKKITNATHTIAVMSGNFMQRGTPALLDKFTRAEMAVRNGVDLFYYITENKLYDTSEEDLLNMLNSPNNILGIEYIKSILKLNSKIKPYTINRINSGYNSLNVNDSICSASAIRNALKNNSLDTINYTMPKDTYDIINRVIESGFNLVYNEDFYQILSSIIIRDKDNLTDYFEVNEGIENKIYNSIFKCHNIETLQNEIKSKRYTMTKISRTLNNIMLGIKGGDILKTKDLTNIPYVRVLAFNEKGCEILKEIKKNSEIEVITKFSKIKYINSNIFNTLINYDIKATNMYNLIYYKDNFDMLKAPLDYITSPKYIK